MFIQIFHIKPVLRFLKSNFLLDQMKRQVNGPSYKAVNEVNAPQKVFVKFLSFDKNVVLCFITTTIDCKQQRFSFCLLSVNHLKFSELAPLSPTRFCSRWGHFR